MKIGGSPKRIDLSMRLGGYMGRVVHVDLTDGTVNRKDLNPTHIRGFIGGSGVNTKILQDLLEPGLDPFSPSNPVIFGAGPLVGTGVPGAPKVAATTKLPATSTVASGVGGGAFGLALKAAGYDHLIITGKAQAPSYLVVGDDGVEISAASALWGEDIIEATEALWRRYEKERLGPRCSVLCIGPAGEHRVRFALTLIDKMAHLGRGGLGAVLGAKNLKGIVAKGERRVPVSNPDRLRGVLKDLMEKFRADPNRQRLVKLGIMVGWDAWAKAGQLVYRNATRAYPEDRALTLFGPEEYLKIKDEALGCPSCPTPCKGRVVIREGEFSGLTATTPEFQSALTQFGIRLEDGAMDKAVKLYDLANRYGIDCIEVRGLVEFLMELRERGLLGDDVLDGLEPKGDFKTFKALLEKISRREEFGDILAEGWRGLLAYLGPGFERYAVQFKGLTPLFDARANFGAEAFGQITNPRGHEGPVNLTVIPGRPPPTLKRYLARIGCSEGEVGRVFEGGRFNVARYTRYVEDWLWLLNTLGVCRRESVIRFYDLPLLAELYASVTGVEVGLGELRKVGERVWNLERLINLRESYSGREMERYPERWLEPLLFEGRELRMTDYFREVEVSRSGLEGLIRDYYEERGWDPDLGTPTERKMIELGLNNSP